MNICNISKNKQMCCIQNFFFNNWKKLFNVDECICIHNNISILVNSQFHREWLRLATTIDFCFSNLLSITIWKWTKIPEILWSILCTNVLLISVELNFFVQILVFLSHYSSAQCSVPFLWAECNQSCGYVHYVLNYADPFVNFH